MLSRKISPPILLNSSFVFTAVWVLITVPTFLVNTFLLDNILELNALAYFYVLAVGFVWIVFSFVGKAVYISLRTPALLVINPRSWKIVKTRLSILLPIYLIFKVLDVTAVTGQLSIHPDVLNSYRYILTEGGGSQVFGFINVLNSIFFFLPCLIFIESNSLKPNRFFVYGLLIIWLLFVYLSTARSAVFLSLLVYIFFRSFYGLGFSKLIGIFALLFVAFFLLGAISGKTDIMSIVYYAYGPFLALNQIIDNPSIISYQLLSFRPLHSFLSNIGLMDESFQLLDYIYVPFPTNVYTVFGVYFNDFGFFASLLFFAGFSLFTTICIYKGRANNSLRYQISASFLLSFIVLGVFYDYYTSSGFVFILPVMIYLFAPASTRQ